MIPAPVVAFSPLGYTGRNENFMVCVLSYDGDEEKREAMDMIAALTLKPFRSAGLFVVRVPATLAV
jgi:hypothetical protein